MFGMGTTELLVVLLVAGLVLAVYFLPTVIANVRRRPQAVPISFLNPLLGWTLLGWVGALVWALIRTAEKEDPSSANLVQCPACFGQVDARPTACRHCRTPLPT